MIVMHIGKDGKPTTHIANFRPHVPYSLVHQFVATCLPETPFGYVVWEPVNDLFTLGDEKWLSYEDVLVTIAKWREELGKQQTFALDAGDAGTPPDEPPPEPRVG